eukprot:11587397-Alexandrium_andersonii.AAC.1
MGGSGGRQPPGQAQEAAGRAAAHLRTPISRWLKVAEHGVPQGRSRSDSVFFRSSSRPKPFRLVIRWALGIWPKSGILFRAQLAAPEGCAWLPAGVRQLNPT